MYMVISILEVIICICLTNVFLDLKVNNKLIKIYNSNTKSTLGKIYKSPYIYNIFF